MGTFVSDPDSELFADKEAAPGLSLRPGWVPNNVMSADDANSLKHACEDLREAHLELVDTVENLSTVGDATPQPVGAANVVGVALGASREDHVHAHGNQLGGALHANVGASAGFMSAADKTKLDGIAAGATAGVTTLAAVGASPNANGASISGSILTLQLASAAQPGLISAANYTKLTSLGAAGTPSVSIGTLTAPSSFNLSTEGTVDWVDSNGLTLPRPISSTALLHHKIDGSRKMFDSLLFFAAGATGFAIGSGPDAPFTKSTTASDDSFTAALSATTYTYGYTATAAQTGYGFLFDVPCKTTSQTLNLYVGVWSGTITISATLSDGTTASTTMAPGAGASLQRKVPITFTGASLNDVLRVKVRLTTNNGSTPNVQFYCATLA